MNEKKKQLRLDSLSAHIREPLQLFADQIISTLGENLLSITVVGSSLTEDFKPGTSDINTVLVLNQQNLNSLTLIASLAKPMSRKKISPPLLTTRSYIERSLDVFGIEFLDFQLRHKTILGDDPFADLTFKKQDVRLQCERELKAMLIRLRQGYIAAVANKKLVRDILISTAKGLAPLLRAMLWLIDTERPVEDEQTFLKAAEQFSIIFESVIRSKKWRHEKSRPDKSQIDETFESVYSSIDQLSDLVDKLEA
jgi:hypothetical protein